jgi:hypothetical protein
MAPDPPVYSGGGFGSLSPKPGRTITATVTYDPTAETNPYNLVLTVTADGTTHTGNVNTTCLDAKNRPCHNVNAEWIAEEVDGRALASFQPWTLTGGYATTSANPAQQSIQALKAEAQNLQPGGTKVLAYACNLSGASFTVQRSAC